MAKSPVIAPESTAARVALWRALHGEVDAAPHVIADTIGLALLAPSGDWRRRPDMNPRGTSAFRASILARARFVEDLVAERAGHGVDQYVILGAGLDSFAQRRADLPVHVFEIDQPGPQAWKRRRLVETGHGVPERLHFVPVDFEAGDDWWQRLVDSGFDPGRPAIFASTGVSMYLTREATAATMRRIAGSAPGSRLVMSFLLPFDRLDAATRSGVDQSAKGARAGGTPFISFYTPEDVLALATECGFATVAHISADELAERYFADRPDGLRPPSNAEELLVAAT